ncbi:MAG: hypothetical protein IPM88_20380 [Nitrospira sp.]|nr:hypothetical protein [Nitrospira sp.]
MSALPSDTTWWCHRRADRRLQAGDYIHFNGRSSKFSESAWGILWVLDKDVSDLQKLPAGYSGRNEIPKASAVGPAERR